MLADRYVKGVLTVIALALVAIAAHLWRAELRPSGKPPDALLIVGKARADTKKMWRKRHDRIRPDGDRLPAGRARRAS